MLSEPAEFSLSDQEVWMLAALVPALSEGSPESQRLYGDWISQKSIPFRERWPQWNCDRPSHWLRQLLHIIEAGCIEIHSAAKEKGLLELFPQCESLSWLRSTCFDAIHRSTTQEREELSQREIVRQQVYDLAYGLTHEINNPLANISARAQLLMSQFDDRQVQKNLATIIDQAQRGHEMLAELMLAVQSPPAKAQLFELIPHLRVIGQRVEQVCREAGIQFQVDLPARCIELRMDPTDLDEALWIASRNAWEACRAGDTLLWRVRVEDSWMRLEIVDNGPGIPESMQDRIWNFYYSGREAGRGLGLGLCKLKRIVERNQGTIRLESSEHAGCTLCIHIPLGSTQTFHSGAMDRSGFLPSSTSP